MDLSPVGASSPLLTPVLLAQSAMRKKLVEEDAPASEVRSESIYASKRMQTKVFICLTNFITQEKVIISFKSLRSGRKR